MTNEMTSDRRLCGRFLCFVWRLAHRFPILLHLNNKIHEILVFYHKKTEKKIKTMSLVITQQTFDEAVQENIDSFDMSAEEALKDTISQFEAQGVNLANIVKESGVNDDFVKNIIKSLTDLIEKTQEENEKTNEAISDQTVIAKLNEIKDECSRDLAIKLLFAKHGAYEAILMAMNRRETVILAGTKTMIELMTGNPDLLNKEGIDFIIANLKTESLSDAEIAILLRWASVCCVKHEGNRQIIFDAGILEPLCAHMHNNGNKSILLESCSLIRHLVLDDDIRVEFGKAHEHARLIALGTLPKLTGLLTDFKSDERLVSDILITLASLIVRNEFCTTVEEAGGLRFILDILVEFHERDRPIRQCFKLLKVLAGNDDVKKNIIQSGAAPLIASSLNRHKASEKTAVAGLACVSAICLREPINGLSFLESGIAEPIVQCMKIYPESIDIQRNASCAIRNIVNRNKEHRGQFLEIGAEDLLNQFLLRWHRDVSFEAKSALRDLGCGVKFEEQWTGKGGQIDTAEHLKTSVDIA